MPDPAMLGESGYDRIENNAYFTEPEVTLALMRHIKFTRHVWEPCAGRGDMAKVIEFCGLPCRATDLLPYASAPDWGGQIRPYIDFLEYEPGAWSGDIIMNPPYDKPEQFVIHALAVTRPHRGRVAVLLRNEWDSAKGRAYLFDEPPFCKKMPLRWRPRWDWWQPDWMKKRDKNGNLIGPRHNFAWFLWDWAHKTEATIKGLEKPVTRVSFSRKSV